MGLPMGNPIENTLLLLLLEIKKGKAASLFTEYLHPYLPKCYILIY